MCDSTLLYSTPLYSTLLYSTLRAACHNLLARHTPHALSMPQPLHPLPPDTPTTLPQVVGVLRETLQSPPAEWEAVLRAQFTDDGAAATPDMVLGALQDKMA